MKENEQTCGTCSNNEDGFCDCLGRLVEDDDNRCHGIFWKEKNDND